MCGLEMRPYPDATIIAHAANARRGTIKMVPSATSEMDLNG